MYRALGVLCVVIAAAFLVATGCQRPAAPSQAGSAPSASAVKSGEVPVADPSAPLPPVKKLKLTPGTPLRLLGTDGPNDAYEVLPGTAVQIRAIATLEDGSALDVTGHPDAFWFARDVKMATVSKGITTIPSGARTWIEIYASVRSLRTAFGIELVPVQPANLPEKMSETIRKDFPGFRVPGDEDFKMGQLMRGLAPRIIRGDFDENGLEDAGLFLISDTDWKFVILHQRPGGSYETAYTMGEKFGQGQKFDSLPNLETTLIRKGQTIGRTKVRHDSLYFDGDYGLTWNGEDYEKFGVPYE
jgi:hypothetical protein